jgi:uncharacterized protein YhjY with autotransporter beta-barrel domain
MSLSRRVPSFGLFVAVLGLALLGTALPAGAQSQGEFRLVPVSPTTQSVVLGDRPTFEVRLLDPRGAPVPGVQLTWEIVAAPGSPRGTSGAPSPTDANGVARAAFGFGVAGNVTIRTSFRSAANVVLFQVTVQSLGTLVSDNSTRETAGGAFDDICHEVFNNPDGTPRPVPRATPLCVFMTGVLTTQAQRSEALEAMSPTGLGSASKTAAAGALQQQAAVASRLGALRSGLAAGTQISMSAGSRQLDSTMLADAASEQTTRLRLGSHVDDAAWRGFRGLGQDTQPPAAVVESAPERERGWGLFFTGRLQQGEQSGEVGDETAFDFDTLTGTLGLDFAIGPNSFLGVAGGYSTNETELGGDGGELEFDSLSFTLYAAWQASNGAYLQATGEYGASDYDQSRRIALPVVGNLEARSAFDGDQAAATLEGGWIWGGQRWVWSSFLRGSWTRAQVDAFAEEGAVANVVIGGVPVPTNFGVAVEEQELQSLLGEAGVDLSGNFSTASAVLVPQFNLTYRHEFDNDARAVHATFLGDQVAGSSFFVFLDEADRDWLSAGASLSAQYLWGSLFVSYDHEFEREDLELSTWQAGLRFEF